MYLITYQKRNGDIFCRIRNTIPDYTDGKTTSMGWKILDVKYRFKDSFYTLPQCSKLQKRQILKYHVIKNIKKLVRTYATTILLLSIILYLLIK